MSKVLNRMDKILLIISVLMFVFGLFMILDASSMKSFLEYGTNNKYFYKQLVILLLSLFLSIIILFIPMKKYKKYILPICTGIGILLLYLLISGVETNSARSWIYIGSFGLQPSEFAKLGIIMFTGIYYKANQKFLHKFLPAVIPVLLGGVYTLLTLLQPDGGTGLIIFFITLMLFYASPVTKDIKIKSTLIGAGFVIIVLLILLISGKSIFSKMQADRFNFLKPCTRYQESTGYQVCNGYIAINNGKLFSISPGNAFV